MSRGKYRAEEVTLVDGEFAEPNLDEHGNLVMSTAVTIDGDLVVTGGHIITDPTSVTTIYGAVKGDTVMAQPTVTPVDADVNGLDVVVHGEVSLSAATITALAEAIAAAMV